MSQQQSEAGQYLVEHGVAVSRNEARTTLEIAEAFGYVATTSAGVEIQEDSV